MAALNEKLNAFLETHSYLGDDLQATKEDYRVCGNVTSVNADSHPHLARWHSHISYLATTYPNFDWRGCPVPAGKDRVGAGGAPAASSKPAAAKQAAKPSSPKAAPKAAPAATGGAVDEEAVKRVGDEIRVLKEKLKAEGIAGKKLNDHPEVAALVSKLSALKAGGPAPAAASPKGK